MQYRIDLSPSKMRYLQLGAFGNIERKFNTNNDYIRETWVLVPTDASRLRLDSVYQENNVEEIVYPASLVPDLIEQLQMLNGGWLIAVDMSVLVG
jgi:hypothetical protein